MTELITATERSPASAASADSLLHHYGFDLSGHAIEALLLSWQEQYPQSWLYLATIEALYQGRYKAISVAQILALWQRRGQPIYHFNHEFERLVCDRLPQTPASPVPVRQEPASMQATQALTDGLQRRRSVLKTAPTVQNVNVMQVLRTLHNSLVADTSPADGLVAANELPLVPPYSYRLRSQESRFQPSSQQQSEPLTQSNLDPTPLLSDVFSDVAASTLTVNHETLEASSIAATTTPADVEPIDATNQPASDAASSTPSNSAPAQATTHQGASIARILQQLNDQERSAKTTPSVGLLAQMLKPQSGLQLTRYQPTWLTNPSHQPIHQFTPTLQASDFHTKLKTAAQLPGSLPDQPDDLPADA